MSQDPGRSSQDHYDRAAVFADRIELELRRLGMYHAEAPPEEAFHSRVAFFGDTMSFPQWLQFVLIARVRELAASRGQFPRQSQVGAYAVRELDGYPEAGRLVSLLGEFDAFVEHAAADLERRKREEQDTPAMAALRLLAGAGAEDAEVAAGVLSSSSAWLRLRSGLAEEAGAQLNCVGGLPVEDGDGWQVPCTVVRSHNGAGVEEHFLFRAVREDDAWKVDLPATLELMARTLADRFEALSGVPAEMESTGNCLGVQEAIADCRSLARGQQRLIEIFEADPAWLEKMTGDTEAAARLLPRRAAEYWAAVARQDGSAAAFESEWPAGASGMDVGMAQGVWDSARGLVEICADTFELKEDEEASLPVVVEAERGQWVVMMAFRLERRWWKLDPVVSVETTMRYYLRQHHIHPPFAGENSARARAMEFWRHLQCNDQRRALECVMPATAWEPPKFGAGHIDEFFWYIGQRQMPGGVEVRVLMNTHEACRMWRTWMMERDGAWYVDVQRTFESGGEAPRWRIGELRSGV